MGTNGRLDACTLPGCGADISRGGMPDEATGPEVYDRHADGRISSVQFGAKLNPRGGSARHRPPAGWSSCGLSFPLVHDRTASETLYGLKAQSYAP